MVRFTERQYEILRIISSTNSHTASRIITSDLGITRRTLINDIKAINTENEIISSNNNGYFINPSYLDEIADLLSNSKNSEDNIDHIIKYILIKNNALTVNEITDNFYISSSKLLKLFPQINNQLKPYGLVIERKNNHVCIEGTEQNKRQLLGNIIHNESYSFFSEIDNFKDYFPNIPVNEICSETVALINEYGYTIPKYYEINFLINFLVAVSRNPFIISNTIEDFPTTSQKYDARILAYKINEMLETKFHMHYINKLITIKEFEQALDGFISRNGEKPRVFDLSDSFIKLIRKNVEETFKYYYLTSIDCQDFLSVFCLHVSEMIKRCMNSISFVPTNISIKQNAPYIYEIAVSIASKIAKDFNVSIPEVEINLIAIHIGYAIEQAAEKSSIAPLVLVSQFQKTNSILADKIVKEIGYKIQIMGFYSSISDIPYRLYKNSLIISTELETNKNNNNICCISPFVSDKDINKVQEAITLFIKKKNTNEVSNLINRYLTKDTFYVLDGKMDKYDAINFLCEKAFENKDVLEGFHNQVISREKLSSTCFFDKFAIPHSNIQNAINTKLYVMLNKSKVNWDKSRINLVCLILIKRDANDDFRKLYAGLTDVLCDNSFLFNNIDKIKNLNDFLYFLLK